MPPGTLLSAVLHQKKLLRRKRKKKRKKRIGKSNSRNRRRLKSKGNLNTRSLSRQRRSSCSREISLGSRRRRRLSLESSTVLTTLQREPLTRPTTILLKSHLRSSHNLVWLLILSLKVMLISTLLKNIVMSYSERHQLYSSQKEVTSLMSKSKR